MEVQIEYRECFRVSSAVKELLEVRRAVENYLSKYESIDLGFKPKKVCAKRIIREDGECVGYAVYGDKKLWGLYACTNGKLIVEWKKDEWGIYTDSLKCGNCDVPPELPKDEVYLYGFVKRINQAALKALGSAALPSTF